LSAGVDKSSADIGSNEIRCGAAQVTLTGASGASASSSLILQGSIDGSGWWDISTNAQVSISSNAWNAASGTNSATFGFNFNDVFVPQLRLLLDAGSGALGTISMTIVGKS
jgi:hypothetical protein